MNWTSFCVTMIENLLLKWTSLLSLFRNNFCAILLWSYVAFLNYSTSTYCKWYAVENIHDIPFVSDNVYKAENLYMDTRTLLVEITRIGCTLVSISISCTNNDLINTKINIANFLHKHYPYILLVIWHIH